jgi:hypothetical protein
VRLLAYGALIATVAWIAYHVAYRLSFGPNPRDSEKDLAFFEGALFATGVSAAALLASAIVEYLVRMRRHRE